MTTRPDDVCDPVSRPRGLTSEDGATGARPPSDLVRSVSRALAVLEVVGLAGTAVSAKAIARRTGLNLSTTYHLLHTLCWEGYLLRLPSGDFCLGAGIARRYRDLVSTLGAPASMREVLQRLTAHTGHTGYLGRLVEGRIAVTDVVPGRNTPWIDELFPGFDEAAATPLGQVLTGQWAPATNGTWGPGLVVEDGHLRPDLSCAALSVRRPAAGDGPAQRWAIGLSGPLGCFSGAAPSLRALVRAGEELAAAC